MESKNFNERSLIEIPVMSDVIESEDNKEQDITEDIKSIRVEKVRGVVAKIYKHNLLLCRAKLEKFEIQIILSKLINVLNMRSLVVYTGKSFSTFLEKSELLKQDKTTVIRLPIDFDKKLKKLKEKVDLDIMQLDAFYYKVSNYPICVIDIKDLKFLTNFTTIKFDVCFFWGKTLEEKNKANVYELAELGKFSNRIIYSC